MKIRIQPLVSHRYFRRFLYLLASFLLLFILMNYVILPAYVYHGGTLRVPQVEGMALDSAVDVLERADLTPIQSDTRADSRYPAGTVIQQNPIAESVVKPGRRVYLTLSGGEILVTVPQLRGLSTRDARFTLERYGLQLGSVSYATSQTYPENTIIDQTVQPNTKVPRGAVVSVTVSRGMITDEIAVPEVVGKSIAEARTILSQKGLKLGNITYHFSNNLLPNTVVDQFPRPGEPVQRGQAIDLFVVKEGTVENETEDP